MTLYVCIYIYNYIMQYNVALVQ